MSFHVKELEKIRNGVEGRRASLAVAEAIKALRAEIEAVGAFGTEERQQALLALLNKATDTRQLALANGASGYGDASWAAAAACESWLQHILSGDEADNLKISQEIKKLESPPDASIEKLSWRYYLLFVAAPPAFVFGGVWVGIAAVFAGLVFAGWPQRRDGPFPTNGDSS